MIKDKNLIFIGLFILATQYLFGLPTFWKNIFISIAVLILIGMSVKISVPKKTTRHRTRKERSTPVFVESAPVYPKDNTVESAGSVDTNQSS